MNTRKIQKNRGQAMLTAVVFFVLISGTVILGIANPILKQVQINKENFKSKQSYFITQSGVEDGIYRLQTNKTISASEPLVIPGYGAATTTVTNTATGKQIVSTASSDDKIRKAKASVLLGTGISFHYGVQAGKGGFSLSNSSSITGNVYSEGPITGSGNTISGDAISTGPSGLVQGVQVSGSVYAHTIGSNTQINNDAYYTTLGSNVTVSGTRYPNSTDQATSSLPISDQQITDWESDAAAGGTLSSSFCDSYNSSSNTCTFSSSKTLGPKKIPFNLVITGSSNTLTVTGPLWVVGNITCQTGAKIKMSATLGSTNVAIIADDPSNSSTSGKISITQSSSFEGSGSPGSFVFMISQNDSAENGGSVDAISISQSSSGLVAYASHGQISLSQSVSLKEVTAYKINLSQSANVTYDTGLPSTLFASGPAGGYAIQDWSEVQ